MSKNYTDRDHAIVLETIYDNTGDTGDPCIEYMPEAILEALDKAGRITPPWEPCQREDIRKGDRVRVELGVSKTVEEYTAVDDHSFDNSSRGARWFRIPAPAPAVEWPEEPGPYLVTWEDKSTGKVYRDMWMLLHVDDSLRNAYPYWLEREAHGDVFTLLSVEKGVVAE